MANEQFPIRSGVSREYRRAFVLDEDSLRRIEAKLLKAKEDLEEETKAVLKGVAVFVVLCEGKPHMFCGAYLPTPGIRRHVRLEAYAHYTLP